jgi:hypothetical protein
VRRNWLKASPFRRWLRTVVHLLPEVGDHEMITLWDANGPVSPVDLGVPHDLAASLQEWATEWEQASSGWADDDSLDEDETWVRLNAAGVAFARQLAAMLDRPITYEDATYWPPSW